ncbi:unnamed protein product [Vitrella brassicaformis CCMP3155]|uniref:Enoyl reductase (ER) domain-containing protein n=2 Tax=Vitrella brassicaformis TaxID=1169539 RepID=A0A0G4H3C3_VITBC|nr:unnamed protein product [Vitrella brassicaformis CCMP3155]|eukprot:CEM38210.1 unnamed protein product [Vitrella brassicaformis CCMP3155]
MCAQVLVGHGGADKLVFHDDWPTPRPKSDEVLIKVGACGLNPTDINTRTAWYSKKVKEGLTTDGGRGGFGAADAQDASWRGLSINFPRIQGADVVGRVVAVGSSVPPSRLNERVLVDPWIKTHPEDPTQCEYLGSECDGGACEYTAVPSTHALAIDSDLTDSELATFPCTLHTAETLALRLDVQPGETVVISGASGGVGSAAVQLCHVRGARVIAIASKSKHDLVRSLGAAAVVDRNQPQLAAAILKAASNQPIDAAIDVVGGTLFPHLLEVLRRGGRYAASGAIAGPICEMDLRSLYLKDLRLLGATVTPVGTMRRLVKLIEERRVRPVLAKTFPLRQLREAQEMLMEKKHVGNIVVTMEEEE